MAASAYCPFGQFVKAPKLRSSCDTCSIAKVKCTKEKPACMRCVKRAEQCIYGTSKRSGRPLQGAHLGSLASSTSSTVSADPSLTTDLLDFSATFQSTRLAADARILARHALNVSSEIPSWQNTGAVLLATSGNFSDIQVSGRASDLDKFFPISNTTTALNQQDWKFDDTILPKPEINYLDNSVSTSDDLHSADDILLGDDSVIDPYGLGEAYSHRASQAYAATLPSPLNGPIDGLTSKSGHHDRLDCGLSVPLQEALPSSDQNQLGPSSCQCHSRALGILVRLSDSPAQSFLNTSRDRIDSLEPFLQDQVIAQNEASRYEINKLLQCTCADHGYLLVLLSLAIFKIIAHFTAAANSLGVHTNSSSTSNISNFDLASGSANSLTDFQPATSVPTIHVMHSQLDAEQQRLSAQTILSRLSGVQKLIDQLSQRVTSAETSALRSTAIPSPSRSTSFASSTTDSLSSFSSSLSSLSSSVFSAGAPFDPSATMLDGQMFALPFSATLLRTLETDMRDRLHGLSREIAARLRLGWM